jgi:hypothetical protein
MSDLEEVRNETFLELKVVEHERLEHLEEALKGHFTSLEVGIEV